MIRVVRQFHLSDTLSVSRRKKLAARGKYQHIAGGGFSDDKKIQLIMDNDLSKQIKKGNYSMIVDEGKAVLS